MPRKPSTIEPPAQDAGPDPAHRDSAARTHSVPGQRAASRRTRQNEDKRSAILGAALALFSRFGLHGTSIDQVAARADVSKSNLLYHFANKDELYVCVMRELLDEWYAPLTEITAQQDPSQALGDYIRRKLEASRDRPEASRLFCLEIIQGAPLLRDVLEPEMSVLVAQLSDIIRAWVADGKLLPVDPHHLIFTLWATTQHYADFAVQVESVTGKTLADPAFFEQTVRHVQQIVLGAIVAGRPADAVPPRKVRAARSASAPT